MADYRKMYCTLFREVTDAIRILQKAQQNTEELFMNAEDCAIDMNARTEKQTEKSDK